MNTSRQFIINANAANIPLPDKFFHTFCTSPPYLALRSYSGEQEVGWPEVTYHPMLNMPAITIPPMRSALGLESTVEEFVGHIVLTFREVYRVLRDDGCGFIVFGDSYDDGQLCMVPHRVGLALQADGWIIRNDLVFSKVAPMPESVSGWHWSRHQVKVAPSDQQHIPGSDRKRSNVPGAHASVGTPANAEWSPCPGCDKCSATGGYVLRRGSWRHTRAHETVLMCVKGMGYYSDQERVREACVEPWGGKQEGFAPSKKDHHLTSQSAIRQGTGRFGTGNPPGGRNPRSVLTADPLEELWGYFLEWMEMRWDGNPMDVLTPSPESYGGAHYAVYPRTLIAPLLRATAPTRVCPVCGAPWCPVVERETGDTEAQFRPKRTAGMDSTTSTLSLSGNGSKEWAARGGKSTVLAHRPTCECYPCPGEAPECFDPDYRPGWALDPFAGTFTTGEVCAELGVNCIGLDISHEYLDDHAKPRIGLTPSGALDDLPLFEGMAL